MPSLLPWLPALRSPCPCFVLLAPPALRSPCLSPRAPCSLLPSHAPCFLASAVLAPLRAGYPCWHDPIILGIWDACIPFFLAWGSFDGASLLLGPREARRPSSRAAEQPSRPSSRPMHRAADQLSSQAAEQPGRCTEQPIS